MRQSLTTLGFFVGILSLPIAVTICGESVAQAYRAEAVSDASAAAAGAVEPVGPVFAEAIAEQ